MCVCVCVCLQTVVTQPIHPVSQGSGGGSGPLSSEIDKEGETEEGKEDEVGRGEGEGEDMSVQQILMPPDTDFLSSFYEAAQVSVWIII